MDVLAEGGNGWVWKRVYNVWNAHRHALLSAYLVCNEVAFLLEIFVFFFVEYVVEVIWRYFLLSSTCYFFENCWNCPFTLWMVVHLATDLKLIWFSVPHSREKIFPNQVCIIKRCVDSEGISAEKPKVTFIGLALVRWTPPFHIWTPFQHLNFKLNKSFWNQNCCVRCFSGFCSISWRFIVKLYQMILFCSLFEKLLRTGVAKLLY